MQISLLLITVKTKTVGILTRYFIADSVAPVQKQYVHYLIWNRIH